jgi:geranylgeranyl diphosphate synthase type II
MPSAHAGLSLSDNESYKGWRAEVRRFLDAEIDRSGLSASLQEAIRYGSTGPQASRWRAIVVMEVGHSLGLCQQAILPAAVAIEALHCATLSIDDLPSMDDTAERRGVPAMHRRFNEAMAIQASLWLLGASRTLMTNAAAVAGCSADDTARLSALQQRTENELQLGQFFDMMGTLGQPEVDTERIARLKCGRLFALAAQVSAWLRPASGAEDGASAEVIATLDAFGEEVGLGYQILDDLEDIDEDAAAATWSASEDRGRPTIVAQFGREEALRRVDHCVERAFAALELLAVTGHDSGPIRRMTIAMLGRT